MQPPCITISKLPPTSQPVDKNTPGQCPVLLLLFKAEQTQASCLARCLKDFETGEKYLQSVETGQVLNKSDYSFFTYVPNQAKPDTELVYSTTELLDEDGYPTEYVVDQIKYNYRDNPQDLFTLLESIWTFGKMGYFSKKQENKGTRYFLSTAGWSGNEALIDAIQTNYIVWSNCWVSTRAGGHYEFFVRNKSE